MIPRVPLCSARARHWRAALALLLLALFSSPLAAQDGFSNLRVVPNPAPANTQVVARMFGQQCLFGYGRVEVEGHQVRVFPDTSLLCFSAAAPPADFDVPLGVFSPGVYSLTVNVGQGVVLTTTFVVSSPITVPVANHPATLAALALGLMLLTGFASRRRF